MKKNKYKKIICNVNIFIILPFFINAVLESLGSKQLWGGLNKVINDPYIFLCNTLIIASLISIGAIFKRFRSFWIGGVIFICLSLATVNFLVLCKRTLPFTAFDFQLLNTLPLIIKSYINPFLLAIICLILVAMMLGLVALFFRSLSKPKEKHHIILPIIYVVFTVTLTIGNIGFARHHGILEREFPELAQSFVKNGFAYSFSISLVDNGVDRADGYSEELVDSITAKFPKTDVKKVRTPNIIFVQMESFFNLNDLKNVSFSENPVPNFTKLADECPTGLFNVPVLGAGTANTEFEVVTGMRILDFGAGEYPYKTVLRNNTCESIATSLRTYGYTSHFIHNYRGTFYGRNIVYENLGYDNFYSIEYMTGYSVTETGWPKDDILLRYINESLDSTKGADLITAISVQAHGGYEDVTDFERHITVTDCKDESSRLQYEYYANQIYQMDAFIGKLVESVSARDEETILVIYGDHLPEIGLSEEDLNGRNKYQTDYVIWNNMGIDYEEEELYAYHISSKILKSVNICDGVINACHQRYKEDKQYHYYLSALEYDMLYGKKYVFDTEEAFSKPKMLINRRIFKVDSVSKKENSQNVYLIKGEGFTEQTLVKIKYRVLPTEYINENMLEFKYNSDLSGVKISVWERDVGESEDFLVELVEN